MKRKAILCVDDENIILDSLSEQIENMFSNEFIYESAQNAEEALEVIEELCEEEIDIMVIVSDWLMPGKKGDEFLAEVNQTYPGIVKILLTGQANDQAIKNAYDQANIHAYIQKPWKAEDLEEIIRSGLTKMQKK